MEHIGQAEARFEPRMDLGLEIVRQFQAEVFEQLKGRVMITVGSTPKGAAEVEGVDGHLVSRVSGPSRLIAFDSQSQPKMKNGISFQSKTIFVSVGSQLRDYKKKQATGKKISENFIPSDSFAAPLLGG